MSTFKNIQGKNIRSYANNAPTATAGEMWYNRAEQKLKALGIVEAMTSGTPMINTRGQNGSAHNGTQNAALSVTGNNNGGGSNLVTNTSEEYNGSGWTSGGTYPISSFGSYGSGVQTAALFSGGRTGSPPFPVTNTSASYNGTSFGAEGNLSTARQSAGCFGATENTSIAAGGHNVPGNYTDTEEYNGSAWTTVPATFPSQDNLGAAGVQTAAIANANGGTGSFLFDGSAWTGGPSMNTARSSLNQAMMGLTQDAVVALGANPSANNAIESYDGTSWTTSTATLGTGRAQSASSGSNTAGVLFGGTTTAYVAVTEEYNKSTNTITAAAWASGGAYPINAGDITGAGTQTAAICQNGRQYPGPNGAINNTNTYDGSSWTAAPTTNSSLWNRASAKNGTQTAALAVGGTPGPSANSEEYNGSSWSEGPNYPQASQFFDQATGTQTAALASGGYGGPPGSAYLDTTCTYDGSNWTALSSPSNLLDSRFASTMTGTQTAAIMFNGVGGGTKVESWNGSAWSEQADMLTPRTAAGSAGTNTDAIVYGGEGPTNATEGWDGTAFSTRPNMGNSVYAHASCGTASAALATAGFGPSSTATEEFTGETTAINIVDITTS
jgi:hypothetical protein